MIFARNIIDYTTMIWENNEDIRLERCVNSGRAIQQVLNACREERRPYIVATDTMSAYKPTTLETNRLHRILVPVSMLEEETYKAEICTYLARKTGAHIILLKAHDYGSKAQTNVNKIVTHIEAIAQKTGTTITYEVVEARKDSFHLMREAVERQKDFTPDLIVLTASREYGLDDILFGPQERHAIRRALVPVMLINPRADLFSLCD